MIFPPHYTIPKMNGVVGYFNVIFFEKLLDKIDLQFFSALK